MATELQMMDLEDAPKTRSRVQIFAILVALYVCSRLEATEFPADSLP